MKDTHVETVSEMPPCPYVEEGDHRLTIMFTSEWITSTCRRCGMTRRLPAEGSLDATRIDDMTVEEIEARLYGRKK